MDDADMYDEFGNYIGPVLGSEEEEEQSSEEPSVQEKSASAVDDDYIAGMNQIILHEDKQYYPDAEQIYGNGVETLVMEEDAQPLTKPIIEPPRENNF